MRARIAILTVALAAWSLPALAQTRPGPEGSARVPDTGTIAVGAAGSMAITRAPDLSNGFDLSVTGERYFAPRLSLRGQVGGSWTDILGHSFSGTASPLRVTGNVVYNWEGGKWHPFATAGAGLYRYRFVEDNRVSADNELGANFGGGVEFFFSRRDTLTGEVLIHVVPGRTDSLLADYDPRFWTIAAGYKRYF
jgi:hypothetical protein